MKVININQQKKYYVNGYKKKEDRNLDGRWCPFRALFKVASIMITIFRNFQKRQFKMNVHRSKIKNYKIFEQH